MAKLLTKRALRRIRDTLAMVQSSLDDVSDVLEHGAVALDDLDEIMDRIDDVRADAIQLHIDCLKVQQLGGQWPKR